MVVNGANGNSPKSEKAGQSFSQGRTLLSKGRTVVAGTFVAEQTDTGHSSYTLVSVNATSDQRDRGANQATTRVRKSRADKLQEKGGLGCTKLSALDDLDSLLQLPRDRDAAKGYPSDRPSSTSKAKPMGSPTSGAKASPLGHAGEPARLASLKLSLRKQLEARKKQALAALGASTSVVESRKPASPSAAMPPLTPLNQSTAFNSTFSDALYSPGSSTMRSTAPGRLYTPPKHWVDEMSDDELLKYFSSAANARRAFGTTDPTSMASTDSSGRSVVHGSPRHGDRPKLNHMGTTHMTKTSFASSAFQAISIVPHNAARAFLLTADAPS